MRPITRLPHSVIPFIVALGTSAAFADCFDEKLLVGRYQFPNPANIYENYQDLFELDFATTPPAVVRLTNGVGAGSPFDNLFGVYSSNGSKVLYVSSRDNPNTDIYLMDSADQNSDGQGDNLIRVTNDAYEHGGFHWSNGTKLAFVSNQVGGNYDVFTADFSVANPTLQNVVQLTASASQEVAPRFSTDEAFVAYSSETAAYPAREFKVDIHELNGNTQHTLMDGDHINWHAAFTPADDAFFVSVAEDGTSDLDIFQQDVDLSMSPPTTSNLVQLTATPSLDEFSPLPGPNPNCLAYLAGDRASTHLIRTDLYIKDLSTGVTKRMTQSQDIASFDWKP